MGVRGTFRDKYSWVILITTVVLLVCIDFSITRIVRSVGNSQDEVEFQAGMDRVSHRINLEVKGLESLADDWAAWDESYSFVQNKNNHFVQNSLNKISLEKTGLEYMVFLNKRGEIIYFKHLVYGKNTFSEVRPLFKNPVVSWVRKDLKVHLAKGQSGVRLFDQTPYLFVTRPILPSLMKGEAEGVLIVARSLNYGLISQISAEAGFPFLIDITPASEDAPRVFIDAPDTQSLLLSGGLFLSRQEEEGGAVDLWARGTMLRKNYIGWERKLRVLFVFLAVCAGIFAVLMTLLIRYLFISRIIRLREEVDGLKELGFSARVGVGGADEIAQLAASINAVMESFAARERQRIQTPSDLAYNRLGKQSLEALEKTAEGIGYISAVHWRENPESLCRSAVDVAVAMGRQLALNTDELLLIRWGGLLHDIGMIWVPEGIYFKEGPLTEKEWEEMRKHPLYAMKILEHMPVFQHAQDIPCCHHENWDGTGYPKGLAGEDIPLAARLYAVVDSWYSMISERPYRPALGYEEALNAIKDQSGKRFDPKMVEIFLALMDQKNVR